jgi:hypothetical protein
MVCMMTLLLLQRGWKVKREILKSLNGSRVMHHGRGLYLPLMAGTSQRNRCTRLPELQDAGNLQEYHKLEQNCQDTIAAPLAGILLLR